MFKKIIFIISIFCLLLLSSCGKKTEIVFDSNGGNLIEPIQKENDFNVNSLPIPIKEGFTFEGWYLNQEFTKPIIGNVPQKLVFTLYAKWKVNDYSITFNSNGGSIVDVMTAVYGSTVTKPTDPTKDDHTFDGWFSDENLTTPYVFSTMPSGGVTLYAKWKVNDYSITFNSNGGSIVNAITAAYGSTVTKPSDPTKDDHTFDGWFSDENLTTPYVFSTIPSGGVTLYARWKVNHFIITFDTAGGTSVETMEVAPNQIIDTLPTSLRDQYLFKGWSLNGINIQLPLTYNFNQNITLIAVWEGIEEVYTYEIIEDYVKITGYSGNANSLILPNRIQDLPVKEIGAEAFRNNSVLESVFVGDYVTTIGNGAFNGCQMLVNISIPDSVISIGAAAFAGCTNLKTFEIPTNVTIINENTFALCSKLTNVIIPNTLTSIERYAFSECTSLLSVFIPDRVTKIDDYAFYNCTSLGNVIIPSAATVNQYAFYYSGKIVFFTDATSKPTIWHNLWNSHGRPVMWGCMDVKEDNFFKYHIIDDIFIEIVGLSTKCMDSEIVIPEYIENRLVTNISDYAFYFNTQITNVTIPKSVTKIGNSAFYNCNYLEAVTIDTSVSNIGEFAFAYCSSLVSIDIPQTVSVIKRGTFLECTNLASVNIPNSVFTIEMSAFAQCSSLTSVVIPTSVSTLGNEAFLYCIRLESIVIPSSIINLGSSVFAGCSGLISVTIPNSLTSTGYYTFQDCTNLTTVTVSSGIQEIGYGSFFGCINLTNVNIPDTVAKISTLAFSDCTRLAEIYILETVAFIESDVFSGCDILTIYAEALNTPSGWDSRWNPSLRPVVWGYDPD